MRAFYLSSGAHSLGLRSAQGAFIIGAAALLNSCAFPNQVHHITVEYNTAVAGMANELALLNILRAKEDLPLHYTSISRLSGSLVVKGTAGFNGALRGEGQTVTNTSANTNQTTAQQAPAGLTNTAQTTLVNTVATQIAEGVDAYTPSIGGEVSSGPSFDIAIFDSQKFYQGILGAIPFPTVENYINQGFPNDLLMRLLIERIVFRNGEPGAEKGQPVVTWVNAATGPEAKAFADNIACYRLTGKSFQKPPTELAPVSRLVRNGKDEGDFTIQEIALVDGKTFDLSGPITAKPENDANVLFRRIATEKRVADLAIKPSCQNELSIADSPGTPVISYDPRKPPEGPPPAPIYVGNFQAMVLGSDGRSETYVKLNPEIIFRSTEGVIRYLGQYLRAQEENAPATFRLDQQPLFSVWKGHRPRDLVSTELLGERYGIANDENRRRNMLIIALVEQLVNLHKESADRPTTQPVQIIP